ncbi:class I SAM-dependent methyltransferase [Actinoplanes aureus]|uniref:Class I SAM-dependent methyltransferase n=1 Tax=Actinoplanes aureus TaxID=2792083 RepID=A0A931C915_9ACTN|nr:class I SAM-dependent methyltransferase [Actinoplanes aureus]MBG0563151.1 class I SAM-dependent methyltransferase [Actinoplanes aureus]
MKIDMDTIVGLYFKHADALRAARRAQAALLATEFRMRPRLDDAEAEICYLLVRELRPGRVVEISDERGWSTTWLLRALADNGYGTLDTYTAADRAERQVPAALAGRWRLHRRDVRTADDLAPDHIGYLLIDAVHTTSFAHWYRRHLLNRLRPGTPVAVHDVFHRPANASREGRVVLDWLAAGHAPHFTVSAAAAPQEYAELTVAKRLLSLGAVVHRPAPNPMLFCTTPRPAFATPPTAI